MRKKGREIMHPSFSLHSPDDSLNGRVLKKGTYDLMSDPRPNYDTLRDHVWDMVGFGAWATEIPAERSDEMVEVQLDVLDAFTALISEDSDGDTVLDPHDTRTEETRVKLALATLHDFLKLFSEIIVHPPPAELLAIQRVLEYRVIDLKNTHSQNPTPRPS